MCDCSIWQIWWAWAKVSLVITIGVIALSGIVSAAVLLYQLDKDADASMDEWGD